MFLAVVAFILAFGALWFTSEVARRLDLRHQSELKPNMAPVQESLRRAEKQIRELSLGLQAAEQKIQSLNAKTGTLHHDHGTDAQGSVQPAPLSTLDILRGAQSFYPSDTYKN